MALDTLDNGLDRSWESMWPRLLGEAAQLAKLARERRSDEIGTSAASIILARASWDAFANEFVEWRRLARDIKKLNFYEKNKKIAQSLGAMEPDYSLGSGNSSRC